MREKNRKHPQRFSTNTLHSHSPLVGEQLEISEVTESKEALDVNMEFIMIDFDV